MPLAIRNEFAFRTTSNTSKLSRKSYIREDEDDECLFLYSMRDVQNFITAVDKFNISEYTILSIVFDGQKTFIIKVDCPQFQHDACAKMFDELFSNVSPTLLGCLDLSDVKLKEETLESMTQYMNDQKRMQL